jgi:hypothetical protein
MSKFIQHVRASWSRAGHAWWSGAVLAALCATAAPALADQATDFAKRLSTLRGDVEALSAKLSSLTADNRDELRSLARQKADLELELKKEDVRVAKLQAAVAQKRAAIQEDKGRDAEITPLFERNIVQVRKHVTASLPFRTEERLGELGKLEEQLRTGLLSPPRALSRLWTFVEDEFRLTRENGLYQQTVSVDGQEHLADVVRIGSIALFFKTSDGSVGHAVRSEDGRYKYDVVSDAEGKKQVLTLFDNFRKQIRAGYFELPNAVALNGAALPPKEERVAPTPKEPAPVVAPQQEGAAPAPKEAQ